MRILLLVPVLALPAALSAEPAAKAPNAVPTAQMPIIDPAQTSRTDCPPVSRYHAQKQGGPLQPRTLNTLPAADHYMAVDRRVDGCQAPVIANFGVGGDR